MDADGKECAKELSDIIFESSKKHENKEVLTDFNFKLKRLSTKTFSIVQKCLQILKHIKKEYANKHKTAEKKKEAFDQRIAQSMEEFRRQFYPASGVNYGAIHASVPLNVLEVIDYGEDYRAVESNRNVYQNLKKELAKLGPIVEAFLRHEEHFKLKADPNSESHRQVH